MTYLHRPWNDPKPQDFEIGIFQGQGAVVVAVCCSVLQCVAVCGSVCCSVLQCAAVWCSVLQWVAVCGIVLQRVAVCCRVLQCMAVCCSVLQGVAVPSRVIAKVEILKKSACNLIHNAIYNYNTTTAPKCNLSAE